MQRLYYLYLILIWLIPARGAGQSPFYKNFQVKEGLLSNFVYFVFQDSQGYIWISSDVGVSRFDGRRFTYFNTAQGMSDNEVFSMFEDSQGRIWFATLNGKPCFYQNGRIYNAQTHPFLGKVQLNNLTSYILEDARGRVVLCSQMATAWIDMDRQTVVQQANADGMQAVWMEPDNKIGQLGHSLVFMTETGIKSQYEVPALDLPIRAQPVGDSLLVSAAGRLHVLRRGDGKSLFSTQAPGVGGNEITQLLLRGKQLWVCTRDGLWLLKYPSLRVEKQFLPGRTITSFLVDQEGGWWISTLEEGLFYVPVPEMEFYSTHDGLLQKRVICLSRDAQHRLWIGGEGSTYAIFRNGIEFAQQILPTSVKNKNITNIRHQPDGSTYVIGKSGTLILRHGNGSFLYQRATDLQIDHEGNYWIGLNGLYKIPKKNLAQKTIPQSQIGQRNAAELYSQAPAKRLSNLRVEKIVFDDQHRMWLLTPSGLYRYIDSNQMEITLPHVVKDAIFEPETARLWVLTESKGLFILKNGHAVDSVPIQSRHSSVICRDLARDDQGSFWIGAAGGVFQVRETDGQLVLKDYWGVCGLESEKINAIEVLDNQVFIGKDDGLLRIPVGLLEKTAQAPPCQIRQIMLNNRAVFPTKESLGIHYGQGPLSISFEGLSYREAGSIRYRYRLVGLDEGWRFTNHQVVEYGSLWPGKYRFEVAAETASGWSIEKTAVLEIAVLAPIWMKPSFWIAVCLALFLGIRYYIRWREARLREQYEIEQRLLETNTQNLQLQQRNTELQMLAFRLQMNPHFIFNALNTIKGYYGQEKVLEGNAFISKFARLLRLNLDYSDILIPLDQEMELLNIYVQLSQIRYPDKIRLDMSCAPDISSAELMIPSMMIQPFVENAVIHGLAPAEKAGTIRIRFEKKGAELEVLVCDDGIGRKAAAQSKMRDLHKPLATQITIDRLQLLRSHSGNAALTIRDLYHPDGRAAGTCVTLLIPYQMQKQHD
jgi:ligand-binding sensor domain-containing protein